MRSAVVTLKINVILDQTVQDDVLRNLYNDQSRRAQNVLLRNDYKSREEVLDRNPIRAANYIQAQTEEIRPYLEYFQNRIPPELSKGIEKDFEVKFDSAEVLQATAGDPNSLKVALSFVTQEFTLIDSIGDRLLLVKGDRSGDLKSRAKVETPFLYLLTDAITINTYQAIV